MLPWPLQQRASIAFAVVGYCFVAFVLIKCVFENYCSELEFLTITTLAAQNHSCVYDDSYMSRSKSGHLQASYSYLKSG
jgi:hypothetical protein